MNMYDIFLMMWPSWLLGLFMLFVTIYTGNKDLLKVDKKSVIEWCKFLAFITVVRVVVLSFTWSQHVERFANVAWIPVSMTFTVFWEDLAHTLPLLLLARLIGVSKKTWIFHALALSVMWISFGAGHLYQGVESAIFLSFYIPLTLKIAKDKGLGTIMVGHVLYDFVTMAMVHIMLRIM